MAERRMFAKSIVLSDAFLDMPMSARCLYFTLSMLADDDGFVGSPKAIMRQCGASNDDLVVLLQKRFILGFDSGVIVIKHWRMNNYLRNDRHHSTTYIEELSTLSLDEKAAYVEAEKCPGRHLVYQVETEVRLGKDSIDKDRERKKDIKKEKVRHKYGSYKNVLLSDEDMAKLKAEFPNDYEERIERVSEYCEQTGKTYKNYLATIRAWSRKEGKPNVVTAKPVAGNAGGSTAGNGKFNLQSVCLE